MQRYSQNRAPLVSSHPGAFCPQAITTVISARRGVTSLTIRPHWTPAAAGGKSARVAGASPGNLQQSKSARCCAPQPPARARPAGLSRRADDCPKARAVLRLRAPPRGAAPPTSAYSEPSASVRVAERDAAAARRRAVPFVMTEDEAAGGTRPTAAQSVRSGGDGGRLLPGGGGASTRCRATRATEASWRRGARSAAATVAPRPPARDYVRTRRRLREGAPFPESWRASDFLRRGRAARPARGRAQPYDG